MKENELKKDKNIRLAIGLKHNQIKREQLESLEIEDLWNYLFSFKWRCKKPKSRNKAVSDIMHVNVDEIVAFLSRQAIVDSANHSLDDFQDLFKED